MVSQVDYRKLEVDQYSFNKISFRPLVGHIRIDSWYWTGTIFIEGSHSEYH